MRNKNTDEGKLIPSGTPWGALRIISSEPSMLPGRRCYRVEFSGNTPTNRVHGFSFEVFCEEKDHEKEIQACGFMFFGNPCPGLSPVLRSEGRKYAPR